MVLRVIATVVAENSTPVGEKLVVVLTDGRRVHCSTARPCGPSDNLIFKVDEESWTDSIRAELDGTIRDRSDQLGVSDEKPESQIVMTDRRLEVGGGFVVKVITTYSHDHLDYSRTLLFGTVKKLIVPT